MMSASGFAVAVGVLPGAVHRLHDLLGRAPVVLVAGQLHVVVVDRFAAAELLGTNLAEESLGPEARAPAPAATPPKNRRRENGCLTSIAKPSKRNLEPQNDTRNRARRRAEFGAGRVTFVHPHALPGWETRNRCRKRILPCSKIPARPSERRRAGAGHETSRIHHVLGGRHGRLPVWRGRPARRLPLWRCDKPPHPPAAS